MKKPKAPRLVTVSIFTTITIIFWIFFSLYEVLTTTPKIEVDSALLEPITPSLDTDSLNKLETRVFFEEGEAISPFIVVVSPTPIPEEVPSEEAPEETLLEVETATQSSEVVE